MPAKKKVEPTLSEQYLTRKDMERRLQVSTATMYRWMGQGLPSFRVKGARRFDPQAVAAWLEEQKLA